MEPAIEVAYAFWEEGVEGSGSSFLLQNGQESKLYTKQFWVNYYGSDAEREGSVDSVFAYTFLDAKPVVLPLNVQEEQAWTKKAEK